MISSEIYKIQNDFFKILEERDPEKRLLLGRLWWTSHAKQVGTTYTTTKRCLDEIKTDQGYWEHTRKVLHSNIGDVLKIIISRYTIQKSKMKPGTWWSAFIFWCYDEQR